jgi:hypothetical protein
MALNLKKLQDKQLETSKSSGNFFRCSNGKNLIRIFKFKHEVTKADVAAGYFKKEDIGEEIEELDRPITLHYNYSAESKKPVVSNRRVMKEYQELAKSGEESDLKRAEEIKPSKKYFLNVVDINDIEGGVKVFGATKGVYNAILEILMDPEYGGENKLFGCAGLDFGIIYNKQAASPGDMYKTIPRAGGNSEKLSKELESQVVDLYDPKNLSMFGLVVADNPEGMEEVEDEAAEETPKASSNGKKKDDEVDDWLSEPVKKKTAAKNGKR